MIYLLLKCKKFIDNLPLFGSIMERVGLPLWGQAYRCYEAEASEVCANATQTHRLMQKSFSCPTRVSAI
jgi:hypothetical protein